MVATSPGAPPPLPPPLPPPALPPSSPRLPLDTRRRVPVVVVAAVAAVVVVVAVLALVPGIVYASDAPYVARELWAVEIRGGRAGTIWWCRDARADDALRCGCSCSCCCCCCCNCCCWGRGARTPAAVCGRGPGAGWATLGRTWSAGRADDAVCDSRFDAVWDALRGATPKFG